MGLLDMGLPFGDGRARPGASERYVVCSLTRGVRHNRRSDHLMAGDWRDGGDGA